MPILLELLAPVEWLLEAEEGVEWADVRLRSRSVAILDRYADVFK